MIPRLSQEESRKRIEKIVSDLMQHAGRRAVVIFREGRRKKPFVGTIVGNGGKMCIQFNEYTKTGRLRGTRSLYINPAMVHTGEISIVYFDDEV